MVKKTTSYILTTFLCLIVFSSFGQTDTTIKKSNYHYWWSIGIQYGFSENFNSLLGIQQSLNFSINQHHFFKLEGYGCISPKDFMLLGTTDIRPNLLIGIRNLSLLYGIGKYQTNSFAIVPSVGLSFGTATYRGKYLYTESSGNCFICLDHAVYDEDTYNYIGLPLEINFILTSRAVGTSINIYANVHKHPDYGLTLNLLLGKIKDRK